MRLVKQRRSLVGAGLARDEHWYLHHFEDPASVAAAVGRGCDGLRSDPRGGPTARVAASSLGSGYRSGIQEMCRSFWVTWETTYKCATQVFS